MGVSWEGSRTSRGISPQGDGTAWQQPWDRDLGGGSGLGAPRGQAVPAVLLQHELGQILQDLLAVQSHELLPTDLVQGAMVRRRLRGVSPPSPQRSPAKTGQGREEGKQQAGVGKGGRLLDKGEGNQCGEVGSRSRAPFIDPSHSSPAAVQKSPGQDRGADSALCCSPPSLTGGRRGPAARSQLQPPASSQAHPAWVNQCAYGAKPRGGKGWQVPRGQISKIPAHGGLGTLLPGS